MARQSKKLTALDVKNITKPGRHADGDGLYLNVAKGGSKSWVFWFMRAGRRREMGLGGYPAVSLADAREKVAACRRALTNGCDPFAIRQAEQRTFGEAAEALLQSLDGSWRNAKHAAQWRM